MAFQCSLTLTTIYYSFTQTWAVHGSVALEQAPASSDFYTSVTLRTIKGFIDILLYCKNNDIHHEKLEDAVNS